MSGWSTTVPHYLREGRGEVSGCSSVSRSSGASNSAAQSLGLLRRVKYLYRGSRYLTPCRFGSGGAVKRRDDRVKNRDTNRKESLHNNSIYRENKYKELTLKMDGKTANLTYLKYRVAK